MKPMESKFSFAAIIALTWGAAFGSDPAQAQAIQRSFLNPSFEQPVIGSDGCRVYMNQANVPGWRTNHPNASTGAAPAGCNTTPMGVSPGPIIEIWRVPRSVTGAPGGALVQSSTGGGNKQIAELNALVASRLYQTMCLMNGETIRWGLAHRGRQQTNTMNVMVANTQVARLQSPTAGMGTVLAQNANQGPITRTTSYMNWAHYSGNFRYTGPSGNTDVGFQAVTGDNNNPAEGNFLDAVTFEVDPMVDFPSNASADVEGSSGTWALLPKRPKLRVTGTVPAGGLPITVKVVGGTATGPGAAGTGNPDFRTPGNASTFTVTIPAGNYQNALYPVPIEIMGDTDVEPDETIILEVEPVNGYVLGSNTNCSQAAVTRTTYTIRDDDSDLVISKTADDPQPVEGTTDEFDIPYTITAQAIGQDRTYKITDTPAFDADVTILALQSLTCVRDNPADAGDTACGGTLLSPIPDASPGPWELNTSHVLPVDATETYTTTVRIRINAGTQGDDHCGAAGGGLFNTVRAEAPNGEAHEASACEDTPQLVWLRLSKTIVGRVLPSDQFRVRAWDGGRDLDPDTLSDPNDPNSPVIPGTGLTSGSGTGPNQSHIGRVAVPAGDLLELSEYLVGDPDGSQLSGRYAVNMACTNATAGSPTALPSGPGAHDPDSNERDWPVFLPKAGDDIDCVITNSPDAPNLQLEKTASASPWVVGQGGTYTLKVSNTGTGDTSGAITVADDLPSQLVPDWTGTHTSGDWSCTYTGQRITCTSSAVIAKGGDSEFTVPVKAVSSGSATNTAAVGGGGDPVNGGDPDPSTCTAGDAHCGSATVQINTAAAITTKKVLSQINGQPAAAGAAVKAGDVLTYTITSSNTGQTAGDTLLTDHVPAGTTYTGAGVDDPAWNCAGTAAGDACTQTQAVPANGEASSTFTVTVDTPAPPGSIANAVTSGADADCTDCSTSNPTELPSISLAKSVGSSPMVVGQPNSYTLTVTNSGPVANSTVITVRDTMPTSLTIGTLPAGCALDPADSHAVECTIAADALAAGANQSFTIPVTPTAAAAGSVTNTATATGGGGDPDDCNASGDCTATVETPVNTAASITTQKVLTHVNGEAVAPGVGVKAGDVLTYTITSTNSGQTAGSTVLTDHVPAGTTYTGGGVDNPAWSCAGTAAGDACTQTQAVPPNGQASSTFTVTVDTPAPPGSIANAVASSADAACAACSTSNPVLLPSISLAKSVGSSPMVVGHANSYTLTVTNSGKAVNSQAITVRDTMPDSLTIGTLPSGCVQDPAGSQTVVCTIDAGALAAGADHGFTIPVTPTAAAAGSVTNTATATGGGGEPDDCNASGDCTATVKTPVNTAAAITTKKVLSQINGQPAAAGAAVKAGDVLTYTITSTNSGQTAGSTLLTDHVPAGTTYTGGGVDEPAWTCENDQTAAGTPCTQKQAVPANSEASSTFTVTVDTPAPPGSIANAVTSSADEVCAACSTSNPTELPSISLAKSVGSSPMIVGQPNSYTLTVTNSGPVANSTAITVRDTMPDSLTIGTLPAGCALDPADSHTVECTIAAGALAAGGKQSFTIPVTPNAAAAGSVTNTATATGGGGEPDDCNASGDCTATVKTPVNTPAAITTQKVLTHVNGEPVAPGVGVKAGDVLRYTITSRNGGQTAASTVLTDHVPAGTTYTGGGIDNPAWSCAGTAAGDACTQTQAVPANGEVSSTFTVTVDTPAPPGSIANAVASSADEVCAACSTSNPTELPSISLAKSVGSSPLVVGQANSYTLTVSNGGQAANSQAIMVRDTLPDALTIGTLPAGCVQDPAGSQTVVCTIDAGALAAGASHGFTIPVTPTPAASGSIVNTATATGGGGEPDECNASGDCTATVKTPVQDMGPPVIAKSATPIDSPVSGVRWTVVLYNPNAAAQHVQVRDPVPAGLAYLGGSLTCHAYGASQVDAATCRFDEANNRVVADVTLAPDPGASNPAAAANRVEIVFDTGYTGAAVAVSNTAEACWSRQNDAGAIETCTDNVSAQASYQPPAVSEPVPAPVDVRWMLALMSLLLISGAGWRLRGRMRRARVPARRT